MRSDVVRRLAAWLFWPVLIGAGGAECNVLLPGGGIFIPIVDSVTVELVNETDYPVDPGLFLDGEFIDNEIIDPLTLRTLDVDCRRGDLLGADGFLYLSPDEGVYSDNVLELEEGFEYECGDVVTFFYTVDDEGVFFLEAAVNDVLLP
ncbi:MAG: hypothetical protein AMXMBFR83_00330 [Phycisphaerae bacterium]